ncbi:MAG: B12-binding domain-containing radical SAM protein [Candidatus Hermodarchaeota archaeon]
MKILIINLPRYGIFSVTREGRCELILNHRVDTPATLLTIASLLRNINYQIDFIDANGLNLSYKTIVKQLKSNKYDCTIFTFASQIIDHELKICKIFKRISPSCLTIGFSWYAKNYGREILTEYKNIDVLIIEDPFSVIEKLIECLNNKGDLANVGGIAYRDNDNQIKVNPKIDIIKNFDELPLPAYDLLTTFEPYYIYSPNLKPYALIYAGKGCPYGCRYCNVARTKYNSKSAQNIINELKLLKKLGNIKYVWFFDEIFTLNRKKVIEVCNRIIKEKLRIKWLCDSRVDLVDKDLLNLMKKAGCIGISYGVESGSQKILDAMNKGITVETAEKALKWTREAKIPIQLNLLLGYIGENKRTLKENEIYIRKTLPFMLQITTIHAMEGTEFMNIAIKNKWIEDTSDWKLNLTKTYKNLINYEPYNLNLRKYMKKFRKILYSNPKWWIYNFKTLITNSVLILPIISTFTKRFQSINIL